MDETRASRFLHRIRRVLHLDDLPVGVRRLVIGLIGGTILLIGAAMVVLPGPAIVVLPLGLAILATEFVWARKWMARFHSWFSATRNALRRRSKPQAGRS